MIKAVGARRSFYPGPPTKLIAAMNMMGVGEDIEVLSTTARQGREARVRSPREALGPGR